MVPFLILIVTGLGISGEKRMCESIIWIAEIGRNIGCFLYSGFILNNFSKWRGNTSFYLTLFSVTLGRAKHLGAAGSHSFEQFPAVKCASKLKSHEHLQNTCPHHFWYGFPCLFYRYKSGPQSWFGGKHFFKFVKCKNNKIVYLTCRRKNNLNGMRSGHLKNSCFQATIIFSFLIF